MKLKKKILSALAFLFMKIRKSILVYVSKKCEKKHVDLLLSGEEGKRPYVLIKGFNTSMYNHTLHRRRKHFCRYCLQAFNSEKILKIHFEDCFKINDK